MAMKTISQINSGENESVPSDYKILRTIASGSFSVVREVEYKNGKRMAMKTISQINFGEHEVKVLEKISNAKHPCLLSYYHHIYDKESINIYMELCEGGNLTYLILKDNCPWDDDKVWHYFIQICLGLSCLHHQHIIHRDIKPENILVTQTGTLTLLKLADFGTSKVVFNDLMAAKTYIGTPLYMAPEIVNKEEYRDEVDIWALGCVLYYMITFNAPIMKDKKVEGLLCKIPDSKSLLKEFVKRMLQVKIWERPTVKQILSQIEAEPSRMVTKVRQDLNMMDDAYSPFLESSWQKEKADPGLAGTENAVHENNSNSLSGDKASNRQGYPDFPTGFTSLGVIGSGQYGVVFKARNEENDKIVAIKKLEGKCEAELLAKMRDANHPCLLCYFDHYIYGEDVYIIMELCEGGNLEKLIKSKKGPLAWDYKKVLTYFIQICSGVHFLHYQHIIHRDIKPENILVTQEGTLKLADFGASKIVGNDLIAAKTYKGSRMYMAPEMVNKKEYGKEVDIWALGCIIYYMATSKTPFMDQDDIKKKITTADYPQIKGESRLVRTLVERMLQVEIWKRPTASQMLSQIEDQESIIMADIRKKLKLNQKDYSPILHSQWCSKTEKVPQTVKPVDEGNGSLEFFRKNQATTNEDGQTPPDHPENIGDSACVYLEIVKKLVQQSTVSIDVKITQGSNAIQLVINGKYWDVTKVFLEHKKAVDDELSKVILLTAAEKGKHEIVYRLLQISTDLFHVKDDIGRSAIHLAALNGHFNIIKKIYEKSANLICIKDNDGRTALHLAAERGILHIVEPLADISTELVCEKDDEFGRTALHFAAYNGHLYVIKKLLQMSTDLVYVKDKSGWIALHFAAEMGHLDAAKELLSHSKNSELVNTQDDTYGQTVLHLASWNGNLNVLQYFLKKGANPHVRDKSGKTPREVARRFNHTKVAEKLKLAEQNFQA